MIGGAPTSPSFAQKIGAVYSADASEAVATGKETFGPPIVPIISTSY